MHKNRGKKPINKIDSTIKNKIIDLYINEYWDTNYLHFTEIIFEEFNIKIFETTFNNWMKQEYQISPRAHCSIKKNMKMLIKKLTMETTTISTQNKLKELSIIVESREALPRRPHCKYAGEMIQMDASSFSY